jgi:hypothetical protein
MDTDDEQEKARKRRAEALRSDIRKIERGEKPGGPPTPREITDEAARRSRDDAKD